MREIAYRGRRALQIENEALRAIATAEGANVAEILHRESGVNPLWSPPWPSLEPSQWDGGSTEYGDTAEAPILAGIMGHSLCLDTYGSPSPEESRAGVPIHGEAFTVAYEPRCTSDGFSLRGILPLAQIGFERELRLGGTREIPLLHFHEKVENLTAIDRPIAWTQHVTLGPPFADGELRMRAPVGKSRVIDADFGGAQRRGAEFDWPFCPGRNGELLDLRNFSASGPAGGFTTHRVEPSRKHGYFVAWSPNSGLAFGYIWTREDFPWLCRWEENRLRTGAPWNGRTVALGLEFGVSPFVESRRDMVARGSLFGMPAFRWLPARSRIEARYTAFAGAVHSLPESVEWDGDETVRFD